MVPFSFHPSGRFLMYQHEIRMDDAGGGSRRDVNLMVLPIEGSEDTGWKPERRLRF